MKTWQTAQLNLTPLFIDPLGGEPVRRAISAALDVFRNRTSFRLGKFTNGGLFPIRNIPKAEQLSACGRILLIRLAGQIGPHPIRTRRGKSQRTNSRRNRRNEPIRMQKSFPWLDLDGERMAPVILKTIRKRCHRDNRRDLARTRPRKLGFNVSRHHARLPRWRPQVTRFLVAVKPDRSDFILCWWVSRPAAFECGTAGAINES
ncbi:MAG: hypothetical protein RLZZ398_531 [Verrucomicrobiota bacterium]